jgi:DMSO/TMAO reductase YedYZ molybdopterin-dependent catalytic subunit
MSHFYRPLLAVALLMIGLCGCNTTPPANERATASDSTENKYVRTPGKDPLRLLSDRPPNLETPLKYFLYDLTPNEAFFIRWHLSGLPTSVDTTTFRLQVGGSVGRNLSLSLSDLKTKFKPVKMVALCACAGNARSIFNPRVPGAQWVNGGMGNAEWTGVRLKDILEMARAGSNAKTVSFNGLDAPPMNTVPDFVKSLTYDHAADGEVMIAYAMNGKPLPLLNGYPLKLVVPGWYATYWVGMLNEIVVHADTFKGYWMDKAYLIPKHSANGDEKPDALATDLVPINRMDVRSIFVTPEPGSGLVKGKAQHIEGLAFDGGDGIVKVEVSNNKGKVWHAATLFPVIGKYSWRRWKYAYTPAKEGTDTLWVKATNSVGETQPWHQWNRSGYMRNEIESLPLKVTNEQ